MYHGLNYFLLFSWAGYQAQFADWISSSFFFEFTYLNPRSPHYNKTEIISEEYSLPNETSKIFDLNEDQIFIGRSKNKLGNFSYKLSLLKFSNLDLRGGGTGAPSIGSLFMNNK